LLIFGTCLIQVRVSKGQRITPEDYELNLVMEDSFSTDKVPAIWQQQLANLVFNIKDWQITHGMLLKFGFNVEHVHAVPVGVSLLPSSFPKRLFEEAQRLQPIYNRLYAAISEDEEWLYDVLEGYVETD
jgi:hypothetical protein